MATKFTSPAFLQGLSAFFMLFFALLLASSLHGQCTQATDPIALFSAIELNDSEHPTRNANNHVGLEP